MVRTKPVAQAHKIETVPPPVGGLNARDPLSLMPETDAVHLVNWVPDTYGLRCRKGYREWAVGFPTGEAVSSILSFISQTTAIPGDTFLSSPTSMPGKLFACTDEAIYDITTSTDSPAAVVTLSGDTGAGMFSSTVVSNTGGSYLCCVSETDGYFTYDGTTWVHRVAGTGVGQINGANPDNFCFVMSWKKRLWFVESSSTRAWYGQTDAITGTVTVFDFGSEFKRGGYLAFLANWTIDAGEGVDDLLVVVSSMGEVLIYKGTDPSGASTFGKIGSFFVGQIPVGRRGFAQYGGDLVLLSANGVFPMSYITRGGAGFLQATGEEYSSKIRSLLGEDLRASFNLPGWGMALHPSERLLVVSVPDYAGNLNRQYAMSTTQNRWTTFEGVPIACFGESVGYMFSGTSDGRVLLLFTGFFDNVPYGGSVGSGIRCVSQPAFSFFKTPALNKQFLMVRPSFLAVDRPINSTQMLVNFDTAKVTSNPIAPSASTPAPDSWDVALWDSGMWAGGSSPFAEWMTVGGVGYAGAAATVTICTADTLMVALDYMYQSGGPMG